MSSRTDMHWYVPYGMCVEDPKTATMRLDIREETVEKAVKLLAEHHERSVEQAIILYQHERIEQLQLRIKELEEKIERG